MATSVSNELMRTKLQWEDMQKGKLLKTVAKFPKTGHHRRTIIFVKLCAVHNIYLIGIIEMKKKKKIGPVIDLAACLGQTLLTFCFAIKNLCLKYFSKTFYLSGLETKGGLTGRLIMVSNAL